MCQLIGISANTNVDINFSLREFKHRGKNNPRGWGFAFFENNQWEVIKKADSLHRENILQKQFDFKSKIIIGHVRLASCGDHVHENTHPFNKENWVFAHNGTVNSIKKFSPGRWQPDGDTDSEHAFCYLLSKIRPDHDSISKTLEDQAYRISRLGRFNFLLSDGRVLFAYGDNSLFYVQRKAPFGFAALEDDQYKVNLSEIKAHDEKAIIIATEPLTSNEKWRRITGLKIFMEGELLKVGSISL